MQSSLPALLPRFSGPLFSPYPAVVDDPPLLRFPFRALLKTYDRPSCRLFAVFRLPSPAGLTSNGLFSSSTPLTPKSSTPGVSLPVFPCSSPLLSSFFSVRFAFLRDRKFIERSTRSGECCFWRILVPADLLILPPRSKNSGIFLPIPDPSPRVILFSRFPSVSNGRFSHSQFAVNWHSCSRLL